MVTFIVWIFFIRLEQIANVTMPSKNTQILGFDQYHKSDKAPPI